MSRVIVAGHTPKVPCPKHPKYRAVYAVRADCEHCRRIWGDEVRLRTGRMREYMIHNDIENPTLQVEVRQDGQWVIKTFKKATHVLSNHGVLRINDGEFTHYHAPGFWRWVAARNEK